MKKTPKNEKPSDLDPWWYRGTGLVEIPDKTIGFVYLLTHKPTGRMYVGRKLFYFQTTKQVKGKKKRVKVESDWRDYFSSCDEIVQSVKEKGPHDWNREILHLVKTKGMLNYLEAREQMDRRVLESDLYINGQIQCRCHHSHIRSSLP